MKYALILIMTIGNGNNAVTETTVLDYNMSARDCFQAMLEPASLPTFSVEFREITFNLSCQGK